jgi:hypothetical protein
LNEYETQPFTFKKESIDVVGAYLEERGKVELARR